MPYVPAHTNEVGTFLQRVTSTYTYTEQIGTGAVNGPFTLNTSVPIGQYSARAPEAQGNYNLVLGEAFINPTSYGRCVLRSYTVDGGYDVRFSRGARNYHAWGSDSRHSSLLSSSGGGYINMSGPFVTISSSLANRALAEALNKVRNMRVNVGAFLGEVRTTVSMICSAIRRVMGAIRALKHGNYGVAYRQLFGVPPNKGQQFGKSAANTWLEWMYGWLPLLSDVYGGVELLQNGFRDKYALFSVERTITQPADPKAFVQSSAGNNYTTEGEAFESCKVKLYGRVVTDLHVLNSLGLIDPVSIAWELTALSFVVDWLVPVGAWLESLTATVGVQFVSGFRSDMVYADVTGTMRNINVHGSNATDLQGKPPKVRTHTMGFRRTTYSQWPWALPYWVNPLTTYHLTSAIALLKQRG